MRNRPIVDEQENEGNLTRSDQCPLLLQISPKALLLAVLGLLLVVWGLFIAVDILNLVDLGMNSPMWTHLFNDRPVEWAQWFLLVLAVVAAAYLAGRLHSHRRIMSSRFFFLLAIGLGLMLIEEAGDIRHAIGRDVGKLFGSEVLGIHYRVVSDVPYFAALAAVPLYAVLRYGTYAWESARMRLYLVAGVALYALAAISSGLRTLGDFYVGVGAWVDAVLLPGRFPVPEGMTQARGHFYLVDSVLEESVELLAAAMMLAAVLAFASGLHPDREKGQ